MPSKIRSNGAYGFGKEYWNVKIFDKSDDNTSHAR